MDPPLHCGVKLAISWVDSSRWNLSKVTEDENISRLGFGLHILGCAGYFVHQLPWERKNHQYQILYSIIGAFEGKNHQKTATNEEEKVLFHQDHALYHKSIATMAKLHELHFKLHLHLPSSPDLNPNNYWLLADLKRMLQGKKFGSNEEVISGTEAYFEEKDISFDKKGIKMLEKHWNQCITLEGDYFNK